MNYYEKIKNELINNEVYKKVKDYSKNKSDLNTYYRVDKLLIEVGKIYTKRTLFRIGQFYLMHSKVSTLSTLLSWSHYVELLKIDDIDKINYYIKITENENLSVRKLRDRIKSHEY